MRDGGRSRGDLIRRPSALALALSASLVAVTPAMAGTAERPKVGLALAGGGAKGGAHVGVLEVLEELHVPIDYIAGTSMGSIIGGLYASGVSTDELAELLLTLDWDDLLRDKPPRRDLSFRRKEDDARYLLDLELGLKKSGFVWPTGLITGQKLFFMLQSLTLQVAEVEDFDHLPIPFRAVATDVNSGEMVVIDHGNIATAMRASMAIPSIFAAVELEGRLLVDGGVVNNVPVDVVRAMGADVVIAVDLGAPLSAREVESFLQIYQQTMRMLTRRNMEPQLEAADLVLVPAVSGYGTLQFDAMAEILQHGEEEARARAAELEPYSVSAEEHASWLAGRQTADPRAATVDFVRLEGNRRVDDRIIRNRIRAGTGDTLDLDGLADDLGRVYGLGDFEAVDFYLEETAAGLGIVIRTREKPWGPNYIHFGFSVQSDLDGDTDLGLLTNLTMTRLNRRGGELRNDLLLGGRRQLFSELYQPLDFKGRWFLAPSVDLQRERRDFFVDGREVAELGINWSTVALDLGYQYTKYAEVRLGVERVRASVDIESGEIPPEIIGAIDLDDIDSAGVAFEVRSDRLDRATIPRDGNKSVLRAFFALEDLGADDEYGKVELAAVKFGSFGRNTLLVSLDAGWSEDANLPEYDLFRLGGFGSLSGFAEGELRGQYLGVARAGYYRRVFDRLYLGGWFEAGNVWQTRDEVDFDDLILTTTIFVGLDTLVGPLHFAVGQAEKGQNKIYLSLGRTF